MHVVHACVYGLTRTIYIYIYIYIYIFTFDAEQTVLSHYHSAVCNVTAFSYLLTSNCSLLSNHRVITTGLSQCYIFLTLSAYNVTGTFISHDAAARTVSISILDQ